MEFLKRFYCEFKILFLFSCLRIHTKQRGLKNQVLCLFTEEFYLALTIQTSQRHLFSISISTRQANLKLPVHQCIFFLYGFAFEITKLTLLCREYHDTLLSYWSKFTIFSRFLILTNLLLK